MGEEPSKVIIKTAAFSRSGFCPPKIAGWLVLRVVLNGSAKSEAFR